MRLKKSAAKLLDRERVCRVATADAAGTPHVVPVCHVLRDGKIYFATGGRSRKVRDLAANPRVAVTVDVYTEEWGHIMGVAVQGTARLIRAGAEFRAVRKALYEKYPQYPVESAIDERTDALVEVTPARASDWGLG